jgi:hypothetical protein
MGKKFLIIVITSLLSLLIPLNSFAINNDNSLKEIYTLHTNKNLLYISNFSQNEQPYKLAQEININVNPNQNTWIASIFIPGLGQVMMKEYTKGLLFFAGTILSLGLMLASNSTPILGKGEEGMVLGLITGFGLAVVIYIWNIIDAYILSHSIQISKSNEEIILSKLNDFIEINKRINFKNYSISVRFVDF